jgi:hypothetical protein
MMDLNPILNQEINGYKFSIINLREETGIKESYFILYDYLVEYLKEVIIVNNNFKKWYKLQSPEYSIMLDHIYNLVNIYYNYENTILGREDICNKFNEIKLRFDENSQIKIEDIVNEYMLNFNDKIKQIISEQSLKFTDNDDLIKRKQISVYDKLYNLVKIVYKKTSIKNYTDYINSLHIDILSNIELYTREDTDSYSLTSNIYKYNKELILDEIESTKRRILKYVYSKNILHFDNYLHHLRNIYLGIRFYLQKDYMNKRFQKYDVDIYNKFYSCIKDDNDQVILGMIVNKYKDNKSNEYLQEHIFISNNVKVQIFGNHRRQQLSLSLHSYASNLMPQSNKIYCNPMPSMLKIFREADKEGKIKLNMLSEEEKKEIKNKQIICFKFPPIISIDVTNKLQSFYKI